MFVLRVDQRSERPCIRLQIGLYIRISVVHPLKSGFQAFQYQKNDSKRRK
jgi:hypothetical protein